MERLPLGKKPARKGAVTFKLANYVDKTKLPKPPKTFGEPGLIEAWGTLGNDSVGDCVFAGAAHEHMYQAKRHGIDIPFTDDAVISDYSAVTGYVRGDESTDNGTDMGVAAAMRRKVGILDANGQRHKVLAYLAIKPHSISELCLAVWLFNSVGIGFRFPKSAWQQFHDHQPWSYKPLSPIKGGHYVPTIAKDKHLEVVTWGRLQAITQCFYRRYNDESYAYVTPETFDIATGKSPEGFNAAQLLADLAALG